MINSSEINAAADALKAGELVAFPTETVYGLGADATNDLAVARIYEAKGRPSFNPLICHVADADRAFRLGEFPAEAKRLANRFWPGPLTIVVPRAKDCPVSLLASAGLHSIALRVPANDLALHLLAACGRPIVAPSANPSGSLSPTHADHVRKAFGAAVRILDGGPCPIGVESSVVSFMEGAPKLLRPGGLPREDIEQALGHAIDIQVDSARPHAPGQMESHYAPHARLRLSAKRPSEHEVYLGFGLHSHGRHNLSPSGDLVEAAANLFRMLHEIDAGGADIIAVAPIPSTGLGEAINDRLRRAAAPRPVA
jgi:L-threonylcarbamoyladenylate synthase